ncbi:hypothetical protein GCM10007291_49740 [Gemmobacter nanjingensis]|jgi:phage repressor protein C with HTH and peptisase S24 domain|uniref:Peptidase S24/S26A/S26B/S26C domain-containing protein n=1 Tax=Gemmobacter nanjingensis TaxID=488454 RepID=A0ABQ3FV28_9RHOB|nr:S24 family peptidase [Gemmobacter nanjingensis]GHC41889.1 hypothetical protein GCM10007291_49740 [Gemmobacter nanjingensis]
MGGINSNMEDRPNLDDEDGLRARIAEAITAGGGVTSMADKTGIPVGTLSKYAAKTSTASFTNAAKIASAAEVGLDLIAFGRSPLASSRLHAVLERMSAVADARSSQRPAAEASAEELDQPNFIRLPVFADVHASAGHGAIPTSERANNVIAFDRAFLRDRGGNPEKCSIIFARGTSMKPTIPDGSILVVDHSQRDVAHGCIYVFNVGDQLLVKRARWRMDGRLELVSDNTDEGYPIETFGPEAVNDLRVVGRVVYFCRTP